MKQKQRSVKDLYRAINTYVMRRNIFDGLVMQGPTPLCDYWVIEVDCRTIGRARTLRAALAKACKELNI